MSLPCTRGLQTCCVESLPVTKAFDPLQSYANWYRRSLFTSALIWYDHRRSNLSSLRIHYKWAIGTWCVSCLWPAVAIFFCTASLHRTVVWVVKQKLDMGVSGLWRQCGSVAVWPKKFCARIERCIKRCSTNMPFHAVICPLVDPLLWSPAIDGIFLIPIANSNHSARLPGVSTKST